MAILARTRSLIKTLKSNSTSRSITTFTFLSQEPQLAEPATPTPSTSLPPNPATGSPFYNQNWRNPYVVFSSAHSVIPLVFSNQTPSAEILAKSRTHDVQSFMNVFADWMTSQRWGDLKLLFEC
ncbi:hypothetical protein L6164_027024 [Bauhinia variegata]|uniref:Uncharacterized protein n=1 Tax=Bauhinia variegata TaxID=167791 RepID=A0ACB9LSA8_BAUVA|nr:hypothetical protein L6164_027024 [Bauhinia variegata]